MGKRPRSKDLVVTNRHHLARKVHMSFQVTRLKLPKKAKKRAVQKKVTKI